MKDRIIQIMQNEGLSNAEFAEKIGISTSSLSHIYNGRNKPSLDVVLRIHNAYPLVNLDWLMTGQGEMQNSSDGSSENAENAQPLSMDFDFRTDDGFGMNGNTSQSAVKEDVRCIEKPHPRITEIRIFFDNGTYQVFKPENND